MHAAGRKRLKNLKGSYISNDLVPRVHGNHKRLPHNTLPLEAAKHVLTFLQNYAEEHAILLPGRIPGYKRDDIQLLPSSTTKKVFECHNYYFISHDNYAYRLYGYSTVLCVSK